MKSLTRIYTFTSLLLWVPAFAHTTEWDILSVDQPFLTSISRENFRKLLPQETLSDGYLEQLKYIENYSYIFEQPPIPESECPSSFICPVPGGVYITRRIRRINLSGLLALANKTLALHNSSACSSVRIGDAYISFANGSIAELRAPIAFTKRWCAGDFNGDVSNGSGTVIVRIALRITPPSYQDLERKGSVQFDSSVTLADLDATIFGLIDYSSFAGDLVLDVEGFFGKMIFGNSLKGDIEDGFKKLIDLGVSTQVADAGNAVIAISRNLPQLYTDRQMATNLKHSFLLPTETFFSCSSTYCMLQVTESLYLYSKYMESSYNTLGCEIEVIKSLPYNTRPRVLAQGDSLWKIAREVYCQGEMYLYILSQNPQLTHSKNVHPGQEIKLNPMFNYILKQDEMILKGDSLWKRWLASDKARTWPEYKGLLPGSSDENIIFPLQLDSNNRSSRALHP